MSRLMLLIAPGMGLALVLGIEPESVLRYTGAVMFFGSARDIAACPRYSLELLG